MNMFFDWLETYLESIGPLGVFGFIILIFIAIAAFLFLVANLSWIYEQFRFLKEYGSELEFLAYDCRTRREERERCPYCGGKRGKK